jgi:hypothetical protein
VSPTNNNCKDLNLMTWKVTFHTLSPVSRILFRSHLLRLLCETWHSPVWNDFTFFILLLTVYRIMSELNEISDRNLLFLQKNMGLLILHREFHNINTWILAGYIPISCKLCHLAKVLQMNTLFNRKDISNAGSTCALWLVTHYWAPI